ncbi:MAG: lipopolysaccharide biosynthesis protein [Pseudomonadota bacterium]
MFLKTYTPGALGVLAAQAASALGGFVALYCLTNMLTKDDFGAYSFVFSVLIVLATLATLGLDRTLLLKLAGEGKGADGFRGRTLLMAALSVSGPVSCVIALGLWLTAAPLADAMGSDVADWWLRALAVAIVPMSALMLLRAWFQANHRVVVSAVLPGVVDVVRAVLIVVAFLAVAGKPGVALAVMGGVALPVLALFIWSRRGWAQGRDRIGRRDVSHGIVYAFQRISETGFNQIDLILVGLLATDAVTADFAVAARLAALVDTGRRAIVPTFLPRARLNLAEGKTGRLAEEYRMSQALAALAGVSACLVLVVAGPGILALFGSFEAAYLPLVLLSAAFLIGAAAGPHLPYLTMTGAVQWPALIRLGALLASALGLVIVVPDNGAIGAAWVVLGVSCLMHGAALLTLRAATGFWGMAAPLAGTVGGAVAGLVALAAGLVPVWVAALGLVAAGVAVGWPAVKRFGHSRAQNVS